MLIPFGVSFGDFVTFLELVHNAIQALQDGAGSASHFRRTLESLKTLERLLQITYNINRGRSRSACSPGNSVITMPTDYHIVSHRYPEI